jgi:hypothetical protein
MRVHSSLTMSLNEVMKGGRKIVLRDVVHDCGLELGAVKVSALVSPDRE